MKKTVPTFLSPEEMGCFFGENPVFSASIRVTRECNLSCAHCYVYDTPGAKSKIPEELTLDEIKNIIMQLKELGCRDLFITGGEPFARKDILRVLRFIKNLGFNISISTNGTLLSSRLIREMKDIPFAMFQLSVDGPPAYHDRCRGQGVYGKVKQVCRQLAQEDYSNRTICFTVTESNLFYLEDIVFLAAELQATHISVTIVIEGGRAKHIQNARQLWEALNRFFQTFRKGSQGLLFSRTSTIPVAIIPEDIREAQGIDRFLMCSFPNILGVDANGQLAFCDGLLGKREFELGNIRDRRIAELWDLPEAVEVRTALANSVCGVCSICRWQDICGCGCRAASFIQFKDDLKAPDPVCQLFWDAGLFPEESLDRDRNYKPLGCGGGVR